MSATRKRKVRVPERRAPAKATSFDAACRLQCDNRDFGDYWIITDGHEVTVCHQKLGEAAVEKCSLPVATFNRIVRWWLREQKATPAP